MLETEEFKEFAQGMILFLHNTTKIAGAPYPNLLREKGGNGFPTVSFMDHTGRVLYQQPSQKLTVPAFRETLGRLQSWQALREKVAGGEKRFHKALFLMEMDLGMLEYEAATTAMKNAGQFTDDEKLWLKPRMVELEFLAHLKSIDIADKKTLVAAGGKFAAMLEQGRIPQGQQKTTFWQGALAYAESKKDIPLFEKILARGKKELAGDFRLERYLQRVERKLEAMKKRKR